MYDIGNSVQYGISELYRLVTLHIKMQALLKCIKSVVKGKECNSFSGKQVVFSYGDGFLVGTF